MKCPTCGRRPSERRGMVPIVDPDNLAHEAELFVDCPDPIHDLADQAPALLEALEELVVWVSLCEANVEEYPGWAGARAAILAAKGGE